MAQQRSYTQPFRIRQLYDELLVAIPELTPTPTSELNPRGQPYLQHYVHFDDDGNTVTVKFPDSIDPARVDAVLAAHVPAEVVPLNFGPEGNDPTDEEIQQAIDLIRAYRAIDVPTATQRKQYENLIGRLVIWLLRARRRR